MKWIIAVFMLVIMFGSATAAVQCWNGTNGAQVWYTHNNSEHAGTTTTDICGNSQLTEVNTPTTGITGAFGEGYDYEKDNSEYVYNLSTDLNLVTSISFSYWFTPETQTNGDVLWLYGEDKGSSENYIGMRYRTVGGNYWLLHTRVGADYRWWHVGTVINTTAQYHLAGSWDGTNATMYINGTQVSLTADLSGGNVPDSANLNDNQHFIIGANWDGSSVGNPADAALIDEFALFNYTLTPTEITNLFTYNYVANATAPAGGATTVTLSNPTNNSHNILTAPDWNYTMITSEAPASKIDGCGLWIEGVLEDWEPDPVNNTVDTLSYTLPLDGLYTWNVTCNLTAGTQYNSSTWDYYLDRVSPTVTITEPANDAIFYYSDLNNLDVSCNDTYAFNLTAEVFYSDNSTLVSSYVNDSGTAPLFTLGNEYTNSLSCATCGDIDYLLNVSCQDSHTGSYWEADAISSKDKEFKVTKNSKSITTSWNWTALAKYSELNDRVKWGINATSDAAGTIKVKFVVDSDCPVFIVNSTYAGHYVTCNMWTDFQDLEDDGYNVKVTKEGTYQLEVEIEKSGLLANTIYYLDPASGGLNTGTASANFTVKVNSGFNISWGQQYFETTGFGTLHYHNITDLAHIPGALCNYTISDPGMHLHTQNFTDTGSSYFGNFTPDHIGLHYVNITCVLANWTTQSINTNFTVLDAPASISINLQIESGDEPTYSYCVNDSKVVERNKTACVEGSCFDTVQYYTVDCEYGCGGGECLPSDIEIGFWLILLIVVVILMLLALGLT